MDRRQFIQRTTAGLGAAGAAGLVRGQDVSQASLDRADRLPREVWVATRSLEGLEAKTHQEMIPKVLRRMEQIEPCRPDIVCLPEVFPFLNISARPPLAEVAEKPLGPISVKR